MGDTVSLRKMADEIKIDKDTFASRLSSLYSTWKADKRSAAPIFGGANSIVVLMGKTEDANSFQKNNALHVSSLAEKFYIPIPLTC